MRFNGGFVSNLDKSSDQHDFVFAAFRIIGYEDVDEGTT
jgi:hypothetical protein